MSGKHEWPGRGDRVVLTRGPDPVEMDVLSVHVVSAGDLGFVRGFLVGGPNRAVTLFIEAGDWRPAQPDVTEPALVRPYVPTAG
jgi:hypothetical protein